MMAKTAISSEQEDQRREARQEGEGVEALVRLSCVACVSHSVPSSCCALRPERHHRHEFFLVGVGAQRFRR